MSKKNVKPVKYTSVDNSDNRFLWIGAAVVAVIAIAIIGGVIWLNSGNEEKRTDLAIDRITAAPAELAAVTTTVKDGSFTYEPKDAKDPTAVQVYIDARCPVCKTFEDQNSEQLATGLGAGTLTLQITPLDILNGWSSDRYSTRAAAALLAVAETGDGEATWRMQQLIFREQPEEIQNAPEWSNDDFARFAETIGVDSAVVEKIRSGSTVDQMAENTKANNDALVAAGGSGTPTVLTNGTVVDWSNPLWLDTALQG